MTRFCKKLSKILTRVLTKVQVWTTYKLDQWSYQLHDFKYKSHTKTCVGYFFATNSTTNYRLRLSTAAIDYPHKTRSTIIDQLRHFSSFSLTKSSTLYKHTRRLAPLFKLNTYSTQINRFMKWNLIANSELNTVEENFNLMADSRNDIFI